MLFVCVSNRSVHGCECQGILPRYLTDKGSTQASPHALRTDQQAIVRVSRRYSMRREGALTCRPFHSFLLSVDGLRQVVEGKRGPIGSAFGWICQLGTMHLER